MKAFYKIGTVLLALAIFPVLIFAPFVKIIVVSDIASFFSSTPSVLLDDSYSLKDLYDLYIANRDTLSSLNLSADSLPETVVEAVRVPGIVFLVLFAVAIVCAVLVIFFGLFSKNKRGAMVLSAIGAACSFGMNMSFNNIAKPLVNGSISITDLLGEDLLNQLSGGLASLGESLMSLFGSGELVEIRLLSLSSAYLFMLLLFVGVIVWSVVFTLVEWDKK